MGPGVSYVRRSGALAQRPPRTWHVATGILRRGCEGTEVEQASAVTAVATAGLPDHAAVPGLHRTRRRRIRVEGWGDPRQEVLGPSTRLLDPDVEGGHDDAITPF